MNPIEIEKELTILSLSYERQVSRAHTLFSTFWDIFNWTTIGAIGVALGLHQIQLIELHRLNILIFVITVLSISGATALFFFYIIFQSRVERNAVVKKIRNLTLTP